MEIRIKRLHELAVVPAFATPGAVAVDLSSVAAYDLNVGCTVMVDIGWSMMVPTGIAMLILPRSGLAAKHGITVLNTPGLVDPDYRGPIKVLLHNHGDKYFAVAPGDRIAQALFVPAIGRELVKGISPLEFVVVDELDTTERGEAGFGSTGVK